MFTKEVNLSDSKGSGKILSSPIRPHVTSIVIQSMDCITINQWEATSLFLSFFIRQATAKTPSTLCQEKNPRSSTKNSNLFTILSSILIIWCIYHWMLTVLWISNFYFQKKYGLSRHLAKKHRMGTCPSKVHTRVIIVMIFFLQIENGWYVQIISPSCLWLKIVST